MNNTKPLAPSSRTLAKLIEQSKFDDLIKHPQRLPIEAEEQIDDLDEILFEPVPSEDNSIANATNGMSTSPARSRARS